MIIEKPSFEILLLVPFKALHHLFLSFSPQFPLGKDPKTSGQIFLKGNYSVLFDTISDINRYMKGI
jgi:hypothetical protein